MSKIVCSNCRFAIQDVPEMFCLFRKLHTKDGLFDDCGCFLPKSTFDRITTSPEVLAEKLVYRKYYILQGETWTSNVLLSEFETKEDAVAATVAKLKEVENG